MNVTNSGQSAGKRREIVVEILAQAVLDLVLRGSRGVIETAPAGRRPGSEPASARPPREVADASR